jgi:hypothetical protein
LSSELSAARQFFGAYDKIIKKGEKGEKGKRRRKERKRGRKRKEEKEGREVELFRFL